MKKLFCASVLALSLFTSDSQAFWNSPQSSQGLPWLQGRALNFLSRNHQHGPLYNYGPYQGGEGYEMKYVPNPLLGHYVPAYPASYYGGYAIPPGSHWNGGRLPYGPGAAVSEGGSYPAQNVPQINSAIPTTTGAPAPATTVPNPVPLNTSTSNSNAPARNPMPK